MLNAQTIHPFGVDKVVIIPMAQYLMEFPSEIVLPVHIFVLQPPIMGVNVQRRLLCREDNFSVKDVSIDRVKVVFEQDSGVRF